MTSHQYQVHIVEPTDIDSIGFQSRRKGLEVRDCFLILEPDNNCRLGLLVRPELDSTVVESVVRGEGGVIEIDGSRVTSSGDHKRPMQPTRNDRNVYGKQAPFMPTNAEGRFPTNMILKHGAGCYVEGTKKVRGTPSRGAGSNGGKFGTATYANDSYSINMESDAWKGHADEDGKEEVANWICEPSCPVRALDGQSGILPCNNPHTRTRPQGSSAKGSLQWSDGVDVTYDDKGGASRFFKQVQTEDELDDYLETLVRGTS